MNTKRFDPSRITVADIFRAKEERRQRLAKLPFEEKIKIVERLKTVPAAMMPGERLIFESFLQVCPDFAGEAIKEWDVVTEWYAKRSIKPPPNPLNERPDIIAITESGSRIGIELKSWVNRKQITTARKEERIQDNILKAIGPQPPNETKHIGYVRPFPKQVRFDPKDSTSFRNEIFALIQGVDSNWSEEFGLRECRQDINDFASFPTLQKYLDSIELHPRPHFETDWIHFPSRGGAYSPNDMLGTLNNALNAHKNDERYKDLKQNVGLDEMFLLVHYDFKAFAYNTPFDTPNFGFKEAAEFAKQTLNGDGGPFDRIFLFRFLLGEEEAYRIF